MQDLRWPTYALRGVTLERAEPHERGGLRVIDSEGRSYLDAVNGVGCAPLGHAHPRWIAAMHAQMQRLSAAANSFTSGPQQALARRLAERFPVRDARVFLGSSGTEATEAAIKLAVRATGRSIIVAFERAFHGRSLGALSLTANTAYRHPYVRCIGESEPADPFAVAQVLRLPWGDLAAARAAFAAHGPRIAGVFVEPVQGEAGVFPATREFLVGLHGLCREHGALLGADEIQCGSGRVGAWSAWSRIVGDDPALYPDILWLAKALGGGMPIGVCLAAGELAKAMGKGTHGTTFGGNPLACAAALATFDIIESEGLLAAAAAQLPTLQALAVAQPHARVHEVRGLGAMIGVQVGRPGEQIGNAIGDRLMHDHGILATVCSGHTIRLLLPYRAGEPELREFWRALGRALEVSA
ncbi:aminotransferase class III-fold pyridoxal phosphate-dependent enzyme [Nannocystis sp.]|uniref:aspartate aminotransferase family protein n=1 Tax=Nannocystis sp. TaxID=1962667 RepID=UPI0024296999|nr:aminotransferase class III-fold pyridoxal phosphate-dependent enzyme [Nannocystis sp.]MBK7824718.1 aspartate aminotransferase family protein [Nannocystis sp.]MBK9753032.1 aspartate aminotransferase family protein [Nannocystis sp.]